jgi:hypothetical protein
MSIPVVQPILIRRAPVGKVPIHRMRSCSASKEIVKLVRFLNFILVKTIPESDDFPKGGL